MRNVFLIIAVFFLGVSCNKDLTKLNIDPKNPTVVPSSTVFSNAQLALANNLASPNVNLNNWRLFVQHWAQTTYIDESNYDLSTRPIPQTWWHTMYRDVLKNFDAAKNLITVDTVMDAAVKKNQLAIIDILKVFSYHYIVTTFGDIPYTDALDINKLQPTFDDAKSVYDSLLVKLNTAIGNLNTAAKSFNDADLLYKGNVSAWKKFANSFKLKMGMLIADSDPAKAKATIEAAAAGAFTSNNDNAIFKFLSNPPNCNPVWVNLVQSGRQDFVIANTLMDKMKTLNDPRVSRYFTKDGAGAYSGGEYGSSNNYAAFSKPAETIQKPDFPSSFMDYSEVEFLLAEAKERGFTVTGTAASHYNAAITASILKWGGAASEVTTYLATTAVAYTSATGNYKQKIGTQKWISLFENGHDAWTEWRRLDYPTLVAPDDAVTDIPVRYSYPVSEQNLNGKNVASAVAKIPGGKDAVTAKLWFDKF